MRKYSAFAVAREAMRGHKGWPAQWTSPEPRKDYDVIIVGAGGHGLGTAYYLAKEHGITNIAVIEKGWLGGGNTGRNTTIIRSNYLYDESAGLYDHALKLWDGLSQDLNYNVMYSARGVMMLAHNVHDTQVFKRQLLNIIEAVALYDQMRSHPELDWTPRVKFFAGKAAPSYHNAKLIIKLANDVARVINNDPSVRGLLKIAFIPNYNVSLAEIMVPAADLSEQISTAGMEASGTGNMKFALNGALTIGTLDGANVEIKQCVGDDNIVIFGLTAAEVADRRATGHNPRGIIEASPELSQALTAIASGVFSPDDRGRYSDLIAGLYDHDWFMVAADFDAYARAQRQVDSLWVDEEAWYGRTILNTARVGWFSSDRTIRQYAKEIWKAGP